MATATAGTAYANLGGARFSASGSCVFSGIAENDRAAMAPPRSGIMRCRGGAITGQ